MDDREAIEILKSLMGKKTLTIREKEAVLLAIGILSWSALGQSRIKKMGQARKAQRQLDKKC